MPEKTYGTVITSSGAALIAACILNGTKLPITNAAVGDGGGAYYQPTVAQTELKNKKWEGEIANATISTTTANMIDVKIIVPADVGGFIIREAAIYSEDGTLIAVCNTPDTEKVAISEGVSGKLVMLMHLIVADISVLEFTINPSLDMVSAEDMAAAISDHNSSEDSHQDIRAALSNKVNQIITLGPEDDLNTITTSGFYRLNGVELNIPSGCGWGTLSVTGDRNTALQIVSDHINKQFWKRTYRNSSIWSEWIPIPTATPPQRYVLQLADGWVRVNAAEYWRTQEGLVIVTFRIARSGGAEISAAPHPIATLPEGYKPVGYAAHVAASTMTAVPAVVWVGDDGVIYASAAQDIPGSSDPAPGNWPGFVATMVFCAN
ncbi:phage tail-collar fiber domain-containing protein [uncultured Flavonifractor sp.]|uniref:phage tail-collar fiber domain-containing protein n=1 Tax=uncultured Flavonifractor sp. TaxID=1193534 RepID=UPI0026332ED0|nr:phage tail protein [uncultured Flavonifractor sp.]